MHADGARRGDSDQGDGGRLVAVAGARRGWSSGASIAFAALEGDRVPYQALGWPMRIAVHARRLTPKSPIQRPRDVR